MKCHDGFLECNNMASWIGGVLEITSKVRYGLTTRGSPLYRFIPYDKRWSPLAVGCSTRDFTTNLHVIVEISEKETKAGQMKHGNLVQILGPPSPISEVDILLLTYAYDSKKQLRKHTVSSDLVKQIQWDKNNRHEMRGFTFHIDPVGCLDVDDSFTFTKNEHGWDVSINIADVDAWIHTGTDIDSFAELRSTSFYCPDGKALAPMLPHIISEDMASLLPGNEKPVVSLQFDWIPGLPIRQYTWKIGIVKTDITYTYETVMKAVESTPELQALCNLSVEFGAEAGDSHTWVEALMILYNEQVGALLRNHKKGILRRHSSPKKDMIDTLIRMGEPGIEVLSYESAQYCLATDEDVIHHGLKKCAYAYATSPIRRYCDIVNQRILKDIILGTNNTPPPTQECVNELNRRQKQAKAFSRDIFFMRIISQPTTDIIKGCVIERTTTKTRLWIPIWRRIITLREVLPETANWYTIKWYANMQSARWKERIVFDATPVCNDIPSG